MRDAKAMAQTVEHSGRLGLNTDATDYRHPNVATVTGGGWAVLASILVLACMVKSDTLAGFTSACPKVQFPGPRNDPPITHLMVCGGGHLMVLYSPAESELVSLAWVSRTAGHLRWLRSVSD